MPINPEFRRAVNDYVGDLKQREIAEETGISQPYVNQVLRGKVPSRDILIKLTEGVPGDPHKRSRLFASAGYVDPVLTAQQAERKKKQRHLEVTHLTDDQEEIARRLIEDPKRLDLLGQLLGPRVMEALWAGSRSVVHGA